MAARPDGHLTAAVLAVVGGILAVAGSFLTWAEASVGPASFSARGIEGWEGKVTTIGGAVLLAGGISVFMGRADARGRLRGSAIVGGLTAAGVGLYTAVTARDQIVDAAVSEIVAQTPGTSAAQARSSLDLALEQGLLTLSLQIGIWLVIVGGVVGVLAGILAMRQREPAAQVAAAGTGLVGWTSSPTPTPAALPGEGSVGPASAPPHHEPGRAAPTSPVWAIPPPPAPRGEPPDAPPPERL